MNGLLLKHGLIISTYVLHSSVRLEEQCKVRRVAHDSEVATKFLLDDSLMRKH